YGSIVYSEYGLAQWMYVQSEDWVDDNINKYPFSVTQANAALDLTDYKYESDGETPFVVANAADNGSKAEAQKYYRYNSDGEVLEIRHFGTENNAVTDSLQAK